MLNITKIKLPNFTDTYVDMTTAEIAYWEKIYDKDGVFMHVEESEKSMKNFFVHDDMIDVFRRLSRHMAIITDQCESDHIHSEELIVVCNQIVIRGEDEREGIVLVGRRKLRSDLVLNLTSPFFVFAVNNDYEHIEDLYDCLQTAVREARLILNDGKSKIQQMALELN